MKAFIVSVLLMMTAWNVQALTLEEWLGFRNDPTSRLLADAYTLGIAHATVDALIESPTLLSSCRKDGWLDGLTAKYIGEQTYTYRGNFKLGDKARDVMYTVIAAKLCDTDLDAR